MLRLGFVLFIAYATFLLVDMQVKIASANQDLADLTVRLERQRLANKELERQLDHGLDNAYIERIARDRLDFVAPNEEVFIDISGN